MGNLQIVEIIIIVASVLISLKAFKDHSFFNSWLFQVDRVLVHKEYYRLITAGFVHVNGNHLFFNMLSLYFFAGNVESFLGPWNFIAIYFGSLIGGNLFSLLVHQKNPHYRAVGASGAVSGVVFAAIALFPEMKLGLIFLPVFFPAWIFGLGFVLYSIYGIRSQRDNIGHEAHLGGALIGLIISLVIVPQAIYENTLTILLILVPSVVFIVIILKMPSLLSVKVQHSEGEEHWHPDDRYHTERLRNKQELDRILEKIQQQGVESLTAEEKEYLKRMG